MAGETEKKMFGNPRSPAVICGAVVIEMIRIDLRILLRLVCFFLSRFMSLYHQQFS